MSSGSDVTMSSASLWSSIISKAATGSSSAALDVSWNIITIMQKKAIVIGASSGIGWELACVLDRKDYIVGITGRRIDLLEKLASKLKHQSFVRELDVTKDNAQEVLLSLIEAMNGVELVVISAGTGELSLDWKIEKETIDTNVIGFTAMANSAFQYFSHKGSGHLVGISSIGAIRGGMAPAYNASKAFVANYLQGLRVHASKQGGSITITDIQPGFIDTQMAKGSGLFWVASPETAAKQIVSAIIRKQKHAYVTKRWRLIAYLLNVLPDWAYHRL